MAKKRGSSKAWLKEHRDDVYVQRAQAEGYRSRACYKLLELNDKDKFIKPGMTVVDLGSAPVVGRRWLRNWLVIRGESSPAIFFRWTR